MSAAVAFSVRVARKTDEAEGICSFELVRTDGQPLPAFAAGSHQYKFIVDGTTWITDPTNLDVIDDGMGNTNSVLLCAP